jgi:hypothetical protein
MLLATDWTTLSSLVTGIGTLALAFATFGAVRSSNRSARIAEAALQEQRRPLLAPSRNDDPVQKLMFVDGHWLSAAGGRAAAEHVDATVYLAMSLRNVGSGIGVCQGWVPRPGMGTSRNMPMHAAEDEFRPHTRDLYIPAGDIGNFTQEYAQNRWTPDNPNAPGPRTFNRTDEYWVANANTYFLRDASFIRLKSVDVGYHLPAHLAAGLGVHDVRLYASGYNLFLLDKFHILDPETRDNQGQYYPQQRVINAGASLTF